MSIRPVDFNGMIQSTTEVQTRENELQKQPALQQENVSVIIERERLETPSKVSEKPDLDEDDGTVDADTEGERESYRGRNSRERKKKKKMEDGFVRVKNEHESFDIKI
ncbi:MAG: hypothetical protein IJI65_08200 [Lachnospiraceae bacterium]|nr:hypothetical protein [Lachnospiraceae bacterium]